MFDIIGELCFAEPFGCLDQGSATHWSTSVINVFIAATYTQAIRRLSGVNTWLEKFMTYILIPRKYAKWTALHLENSRRKTSRRIAEADREHSDFIYQILTRVSKSQLTETEVYLNIALFISAGTDTTATALTGWTYFMCTHKNACKRAADEVRNAIRTSDDIVWEKVKGLRYLDATINEALRLYAPSPASQQRVIPPGGALIDGYWLPAGTTVAVSPWSSTHSETNFHDPEGFWPERWLGENSFTNDHLSASLPFGNGPRVCIGKNLAQMELRVVAAHMLWNFNFELDRGAFQAENHVWGFDGLMKPMKVFHSMTKPPLWVRFEPINLQ
jgi:cytochrome P450